MERLRLAQYGDRFEADDIDLDVVPSLSEQDLEKLGVSMGHRKKLLIAIAELDGSPRSRVAADSMDVAPMPPKHFGDKILHSKFALEGERKQVTVLFADVSGSMEIRRCASRNAPFWGSAAPSPVVSPRGSSPARQPAGGCRRNPRSGWSSPATAPFSGS